MAITIGLLGAFSLAGADGVIELAGRRQRSLTAILALECGRTVSDRRLLDLFDLPLPLERVADGYRAMDERRAIKALLWP